MRPPATRGQRAAAPLALDDVDRSGLFSGYASLFGVQDLAGDVVLPGAFRRTLERRGADTIKLLYQHDPSTPLGRWLQIEEDGRGLRVVGRMHAEIEKSREVLSLMREGILDGLSIGFRTVSARTDARSGLRRVAEVDLWEISVVTFPMLPGARITDVEARSIEGGVAARMNLTASRLRAATA